MTHRTCYNCFHFRVCKFKDAWRQLDMPMREDGQTSNAKFYEDASSGWAFSCKHFLHTSIVEVKS